VSEKTTVVIAKQGSIFLRIEKRIEVRQLWEQYFEPGPIVLELEECEWGDNWQPSHDINTFARSLEERLYAGSLSDAEAVMLCGGSTTQFDRTLNLVRKRVKRHGFKVVRLDKRLGLCLFKEETLR